MKKPQIIISIILGILALVGIGLTVFLIVQDSIKNAEPEPEPEPLVVCPIEDGVVTIEGNQGKTALVLLAEQCEIETTPTATGETIIRIDNVSINDYENAYWAFYVNDFYALYSADAYITASSDVLRWQLEATE